MFYIVHTTNTMGLLYVCRYAQVTLEWDKWIDGHQMLALLNSKFFSKINMDSTVLSKHIKMTWDISSMIFKWFINSSTISTLVPPLSPIFHSFTIPFPRILVAAQGTNAERQRGATSSTSTTTLGSSSITHHALLLEDVKRLGEFNFWFNWVRFCFWNIFRFFSKEIKFQDHEFHETVHETLSIFHVSILSQL